MINEPENNEQVLSAQRGKAGLRIIIAGGGTGGHIFPAIAIANAIKQQSPSAEILFVGAKGKMEMEKIPQAGYEIKGIDIAGFNRSSLIKNIGLPYKLVKSFFQVRKIVKEFKPDAVIGVGGYSTYPVLKDAQLHGIPTFIHESNSFAGKSNMMLGKGATKVFVATDGMEKFFPKHKLMITGNPVRKSIAQSSVSRTESFRLFGLDENKTTVLAVGGSLGAKSINEAIAANIDAFDKAGLQLIWQTGKVDADKYKEIANPYLNVWIGEFITQMEMAYCAADVVIARSGAMTVAEMCVAKKPVIFVPFPFAAEDHQTVNAKQLVDKHAALMIPNAEAKERLVTEVIDLAKDKQKQQELKENIEKLAIANADEIIAREILNIVGGNQNTNEPQTVKADNKETDKMNINNEIEKTGVSASQEKGKMPSALYFIGIGGIGMSAIARYFKRHGVNVSGYDKTETPLTKKLEEEGIAIHYTDDVSLAPKEVDWVVYTPAIPDSHSELNFYRDNGYEVLKRSDVLQRVTESSFNICIAGTHGKTTVSTMTAHILTHTGYGCNAFLGGIAANYNSNFWSHENNVCVIEADEYDRSFLKLNPDIEIITSMDPDHLDIYRTAERLENAFIEFSQRLKEGGLLVSKYGLSRTDDLKASNHITYSFDDTKADVYASELRVENATYIFNVAGPGWMLTDVRLHMGGLHNIENAVSAIAVAMHLKIGGEKIKQAVAEFLGVKRRFEYILKEEEHVMIDDYAHHPEELKALINGVRSLYKQKLVIVFQPHLFSRTKDQADGFAEVLSMADEVILLPIYPARELPMEGVSSEMIMDKMKHENVQVLSKEEMMEWVSDRHPELLVMAGAGDIDALVQPVKDILTSR